MANKTKGAVILFGTDSAKGTIKLLDMILTAVRAVACPRESWRLIMDRACSIAGGDLGGSFTRRTIATPSSGAFFLQWRLFDPFGLIAPAFCTGGRRWEPFGVDVSECAFRQPVGGFSPSWRMV